MKKRFLPLLLCFVLIMAVIPFDVFAANVTPSSVTFYVEKNEEAGLKYRINFTRSGNNQTAFIPGCADLSKLGISWDKTSVKVRKGSSSGELQTNGKAALPEANGSISYYIDGYESGRTTSTYRATYSFTVYSDDNTDQVSSLYIDIDETATETMEDGSVQTATIARMNNDSTHEKSCFGTMQLDGETYNMSMKGRGNYTWTCEKKPYNFTLYEDAAWETKMDANLVGETVSKKWSLLANYADSTLLRNKIGYELAQKMGIGLESRFVDVWMNGQFLGSYLMTAKSDFDTAKKGFIMELDNKPETDIKDGGDQFRVKEMAKYTGGGDSVNAFTIKDMGKKLYDGIASDDAQKKQLIAEWTQEAVTAAFDSSTDNYLNYFDLDSWAKMYLLQELYKNYDIISGSIMMHRDGTEATDKLFAGPVWDLDNSMGRGTLSSSNNCSYSGIPENMQHAASGFYIDSIVPQTNNQFNSIFQFLGKHASFMERVYQIYNQFKSDFDNLSNRVDYWKEIIVKSREMNFLKWNVTQTSYNNAYFSSAKTYNLNDGYSISYIKTGTYDNYITNLKNYLSTRAKFFSDKLSATAPSVTVTGTSATDIGETFTYTANGTADFYQWKNSKKGKNWDSIEGENKSIYSAVASADLDGYHFACEVGKYGAVVTTQRVASVKTSATALAVFGGTLHVHNYSNKWSNNAVEHWHECSCGLKADSGTHIFDNDFDRFCNVCNFERVVYGDVNLDGKIDVSDCVAISLYSAGKIQLTPTQIAAADVDGSSGVTKEDADYIADFIIGKRKTVR